MTQHVGWVYLQQLRQSIIICVSVCVFVRLSVHLHIWKTNSSRFHQIFLYILLVAVARSSSDGNAIGYVLLVLWITSCFHVIDGVGLNQRWCIYFDEFARWQDQSDVRQCRLVKIARWWNWYGGQSLISLTVSCLVHEVCCSWQGKVKCECSWHRKLENWRLAFMPLFHIASTLRLICLMATNFFCAVLHYSTEIVFDSSITVV